MWKILEEPKVVRLTNALAKKFKEMTPCPRERDFKDRRVQQLRNAVQEGTFRTCEWASAYCEETKEEYRVNGQHTSHLFFELNGELPDGQRIIVTRFSCETLEDVARLYSTFDSKISARSSHDINRAYSSAHPELAVLPSRTISLAVTGMSFNLWESSYGSHPADERAELMLKHADFVIWMHGVFIGGDEMKDSRLLQRGPVVAAMFRSFLKAQAASTEFWSLVRDGSGPKRKSPDRKIRDYLLNININFAGGARSVGRKRSSLREVFIKCVHAWNAWRRNEDTDLKYYPNARTPAAI